MKIRQFNGMRIFFLIFIVLLGGMVTNWLLPASKAEETQRVKKGNQRHFMPGDTATYFGLSSAEKIDLQEFLRAVHADSIPDKGLTDKEIKELYNFLYQTFRDTLRSYSWSPEEIRELSEFRNAFNDTQRMTQDPAVREAVQGRRRAKEEKLKRSLEAQKQPYQPIKPNDFKDYFKVKGGVSLTDSVFYQGLSEAEKKDVINFLKTVFADTTNAPETKKIQSDLSEWMYNTFAYTNSKDRWTESEKQRIAEFKKEAERLSMLQFNTEEKRLELWELLQKRELTKALKEQKERIQKFDQEKAAKEKAKTPSDTLR